MFSVHKSPSGSPTHDESSKARHASGELQKTTRSKSITSNPAQTPATPTSATPHPRMTRQTSGENSSISSPPPQTPPVTRPKISEYQNTILLII